MSATQGNVNENAGLMKGSTTNRERKKDLMSVIAALSADTSNSPTSSDIKEPSPSTPLVDSEILPEVTNSNSPIETPISRNDLDTSNVDQSGDVMTNIIHLLYQAASGKPIVNNALENDETILNMHQPLQGQKEALKQLMMSYANGTDQVRRILSSEVNIIYECKRCRGMFRSLPNIIRHKQDYCTNEGLMSSVLNRAANSSREDDEAFQRILNILHPPEPEPTVVSFDEPTRSNQTTPETSRESVSAIPTMIKPVITQRFPVEMARVVTTSSSVINPVPKVRDSPSMSHLGKFFVGKSKSGGHEIAKPYSCPTCRKKFVEKKSVKRHLITIHGMSVVDAYKAMNTAENAVSKALVPISCATSSSPFQSRSGRTRSRRSEPSDSLLSQCVEEITLGPSRRIHVLPQEFILSSVQCPVCHQGLCRRTNVRRHLLEAHNLIIKGEKKYFQLKDIARNTTSNSPTLRRLRHLFTVTNRSPTLSEERANSLSQQANSTNASLTSSMQSGSASDTDVDQNPNGTNMSGHALKLEKVQFVESGATNLSASEQMHELSVNGPTTDDVGHLNENADTDKNSVDSGKKLSQDVNQETLHEDDNAEEPPPKKLRQLAPMVTRTGRTVTSFNGKVISGTTQVSGSGNLQKITLSQVTSLKSNDRNGNGVKNLIIRRISSDSTTVPTTTSSNGRTFIKVELRNSSRVQQHGSKSISSKATAEYDIGKLKCFTCNKKFATPPDIRRHLITVHSFTTEEALATCYDSSSVDSAAQVAGLKHGFDITNAKCMICKRFYFSRENLLRHLSRTHHMEPDILKDLKVSCGLLTLEDVEEPVDSKHNVKSKPPAQAVKTENAPPESASAEIVDAVSFKATISVKCTKEQAAEAIKFFPKHYINANTLRCSKCKQRCQKTWDLKVHLMKHLGVGFFMCKFCSGPDRMASSRSLDMIRHLQDAHGMNVRNRDPVLQECRVNYQHLWEAYNIPLGKIP